MTLPRLLLVALLCATACDGSPAPTQEDLALRACTAQLRERLHLPQDEAPSQTQMIGRRDGGWLVRGLTRTVGPTGPQNYQCRLADAPGAPSAPPELVDLELCAAGPSPWGYPP